jgi:phosphoenolpyruvate carboxykinase (ATP)
MRIADTLAMITAALSGRLEMVNYRRHPIFNLDVPTTCPGVPDQVLDPRSTWADPVQYDEQATRLARMFMDNFKVFEGDVSGHVSAAGPTI